MVKKSIIVAISLTQKSLAKIDRYARDHEWSRSYAIRRAVYKQIRTDKKNEGQA